VESIAWRRLRLEVHTLLPAQLCGWILPHGEILSQNWCVCREGVSHLTCGASGFVDFCRFWSIIEEPWRSIVFISCFILSFYLLFLFYFVGGVLWVFLCCSSRTGRDVNAKRFIPPLLGGILLCVVLVALFISCFSYHGEAGVMTGGTVYVV
jgi:hypothetical protein